MLRKTCIYHAQADATGRIIVNKASFNFGVRKAARITERPRRIHGQGEVSATISLSLYVMKARLYVVDIILYQVPGIISEQRCYLSGGKISQTTFTTVTYAVVKSFNRYAIIVTLYILRSGGR